jgi:hypothetical protein
MKLPSPRFTTRRMMAIVAGLAVASHLGIVAIRVRTDRESRLLYHYWFPTGDPGRGRSFTAATGVSHPAPFWPRYWRALSGRPWPGTYDCPCDSWKGRPVGAATDPATFAGSSEATAELTRRMERGIEEGRRRATSSRRP